MLVSFQLEMSFFEKWKAVSAMIVVEFALAVVNALFKKVLNRGMNQLVIRILYRI